jgi:hypothetical protein
MRRETVREQGMMKVKQWCEGSRHASLTGTTRQAWDLEALHLLHLWQVPPSSPLLLRQMMRLLLAIPLLLRELHAPSMRQRRRYPSPPPLAPPYPQRRCHLLTLLRRLPLPERR